LPNNLNFFIFSEPALKSNFTTTILLNRCKMFIKFIKVILIENILK
jgi:hypothetical protein